MQGIILCGGLGTRLRSVIGEKQKTMTVTNGEPFVVNVLKYLKSYGVDDIVFATGYKSDEVEEYFGDKYYFGMRVQYAKEDKPLGTGGAIRNALQYVANDKVVVVNGDTLFPAELDSLDKCFEKYNSSIAIACKYVDDKSRYGTIVYEKLETDEKEVPSGVIKSFDEKIEEDKNKVQGFINGGVYIIKKDLIESIEEGKVLSLEKDLIPMWLKEGKVISGIVSEAKFIDIGTPESLEEFKKRYV